MADRFCDHSLVCLSLAGSISLPTTSDSIKDIVLAEIFLEVKNSFKFNSFQIE